MAVEVELARVTNKKYTQKKKTTHRAVPPFYIFMDFISFFVLYKL